MIKRSDIADVSDSREDGVRAEFDADERLTHIGCYKQGHPVPGCWTVDVDANANVVRAARSFEMSRSLGDPECESWLRGLVARIVEYTDGEHRCSFCQKLVASDSNLVAGPGVNICDACVELSLEILIEAGRFSRSRMLSLLLKRRGTNRSESEM